MNTVFSGENLANYNNSDSPNSVYLNHQTVSAEQRKRVRIWFWIGAALVFLMLVIGGITRLTQSGLSMVDWRPLMGSIPPLTEAGWQETFDQYKQYPEYQKLNKGMSLYEFKFIFFWEYIHRMLGRLIGIVFLLPYIYFSVKGYMDRKLHQKALILFGLGALQGIMGWIMVKSGLVDNPYVSHYRLAAHLILAFAIIAYCIWFARDLAIKRPKRKVEIYPHRILHRVLVAFGVILSIQIVWGAFTAGLKAGHMFQTFPLMEGAWMPESVWFYRPLIGNLVENPIAVQWVHRIAGTVLGVMALASWYSARKLTDNRRLLDHMHVLLVAVLLQYLAGVYTLLWDVPVWLGVLHQAIAMVIWVIWLLALHHIRKLLKTAKE